MGYFINSEETLADATLAIDLGINQLNLEGTIVYEYNPLQVYRTKEAIRDEEGEIIYPKNSIIDLDTELLEFDLNHPVDIITLPSYDGSVNLILNDGKHNPKLINTRFTTTGLNSYKIVDRSGNMDTNLYDSDSFSISTSLYKRVDRIPKLDFIGVSTDGNLKVGNYVFYFTLLDADGNETEIIAESGIVSCHIGNLNDPYSIRGGIEDENSYKAVQFLISNVSSSYNRVGVYYTRSSGTLDGSVTETHFKILRDYPIVNGIANISITGLEYSSNWSDLAINTVYHYVESAKALVECLNMLFLGNVKERSCDTKELQDLSLRITPHLYTEDTIGKVEYNYTDATGGYEYYNVHNIYHKLGYWDGEFYRLGIVYILSDYTLSPVFSVRGNSNLTPNSIYENYLVYEDINGITSRKYIEIDPHNYRLTGFENSRGVIYIKYGKNQFTNEGTKPIGIRFKIPEDVKNELKNVHGIKGYFFVRQKRIKTTFCQALLIGFDRVSRTPTLPISSDKYLQERFINDDRLLVHNFDSRIYEADASKIVQGLAAICPEYDINQAYFNNYFTGSEFTTMSAPSQVASPHFTRIGVHLYVDEYKEEDTPTTSKDTITGVDDGVAVIKGKNEMFSASMGSAAEAYTLSYYTSKNKADSATNIGRGIFGPYLGVESLCKRSLLLINIKVPGFNINTMDSYLDTRYNDPSQFYAISDRFSIDENIDDVGIYRGDCYLCNFTHRMLRNFQDPETPINDEIIQEDTWKDHYRAREAAGEEENALINRADVNAVKLGHWVTFKVCSNINLSLRTTDPYNVTERALVGRPRGFFPLQAMDVSGESKIRESSIHNAGVSTSVSSKVYFPLDESSEYVKSLGTTILHSDFLVDKSLSNGYRTFRQDHFEDYPLQYGLITKMIEWYGYIICIFEHGIAAIPVNERALASNSDGGNAYISTKTVLPLNPSVKSDMLGSQWADSVIKTPYAIYGVDTVAKKIWKMSIKGKLQPKMEVDIISDFKVSRFLNSNISLGALELEPILGIRNVKTHYNAFKGDVMFTFYDDINTLEERVWNLCYNEVLQKFVTFYSWVPSFSANIDNIFFTFDRNTSKVVSKLYGDTSYILLSNNIKYIDDIIAGKETGEKVIGDLILSQLPNVIPVNEFSTDTDNITKPKVIFELVDSPLAGKFKIGYKYTEDDKEISVPNGLVALFSEGDYEEDGTLEDLIWKIPIKATLKYSAQNMSNGALGSFLQSFTTTLTLVSRKYLKTMEQTYFWKHGRAGLTPTVDKILPCKWYGKQHPFELEFITVNGPQIHKIFTDLQIISNNAEPESIHFEITGDVYNFADDKPNMFFRQEAVKHLLLYNGGNITYDSHYLDITPKQRDIPFSTRKDKSTAFPLYYSRVDTVDAIEDAYQSRTEFGKDYLRISGSEIIYDDISDLYKIATHIKVCPFNKQYKLLISESRYKANKHLPNFIPDDKGNYYEICTYGRSNGNAHYKEGTWYLQIPTIVYWDKTESDWGNKPPLNIANNPLPEGMSPFDIQEENIPKALKDRKYGPNLLSFDTSIWKNNRKEARLRDNYLRVRIRYTGDRLAVIHAIKTLYTVSFS